MDKPYKGPCWCASVAIPQVLFAKIPDESKNVACICNNCIQSAQEDSKKQQPAPLQPGDFYHNAEGLMVFTKEFHLRRGYCCESNCLHCPYQTVPKSVAPLAAHEPSKIS
jgi:hypothetical protein